MAEFCPFKVCGKSGVLAYFWLKIGYPGLQFFLKLIISGKPKSEVNWTQIYHFIFKNTAKMAISQNAIFWILGSNFFWRLKSKIHQLIYLRNPYLRRFWKFQTHLLKNVGVGILVIATWPKWHFEIWPFVWYFRG